MTSMARQLAQKLMTDPDIDQEQFMDQALDLAMEVEKLTKALTAARYWLSYNAPKEVLKMVNDALGGE